jgi:hypothetical protein
MKLPNRLLVGAAVTFVILLAAGMLLGKSLGPPLRPLGWPMGSVWVGEDRHFVGHPRGVWQACWYNSQINRDRCKFADYKGEVLFEGDFLICSEQRGAPDIDLILKPSNSSFVYLRNGTMLVESGICEARNALPPR